MGSKQASDTDHSFVSRGGLKLDAAFEAFDLDACGMVCADLGCSTGGFVDCLLQRGAQRIYALDTAYGELAWKLRQDERVVVTERTNALHAPVQEACDLVTLDLGWTKQDKAIPAALGWLKTDTHARIVTLIKPHYESDGQALRDRKKGKLTDDEAQAINQHVLDHVLPTLGVAVLGCIPSPVRGGKGKNQEYLALLRRG